PRRPRPVDRDKPERRARINIGIAGQRNGDVQGLVGCRYDEDGARGSPARGGPRAGGGIGGRGASRGECRSVSR
ncbi:MAG: hypothetical protein ACYS9X_22025, partial [Planctomycetota bacterium]